ncbi:MAG: molybdopterin molybdotransferase MoeA [Verrucomicrobiota bacterium JB022]|nr:molybdopterin molybdotransferase MoeA [Verrucomicrobiota bacterium JB022]
MDALIEPSGVNTLLQQAGRQLGIESVQLPDALGRWLANDIIADRDQPPYDRSMMDGYAVCGTGPRWQVVGRTWAGQPVSEDPLDEGEAIEIMTGAPVPPDADAVVPYEWTQRDKQTLTMNSIHSLTAGQFIHAQASDAPAGRVLIPAQARLGLPEMGVAAAVGAVALSVVRRPRVHLLTTGDEVMPVHLAPATHQVRQSNRAVLEALLRAHGAEVESSHLIDDADMIRRWLEASRSADLIVVVGGMSRGQRDFLPRLLDGMGRCLFHGVAQKPGKPLGAWQVDGGPLALGLPGNPLSVLAAATRYLVPLLALLETGRWPEPMHVPLIEPVETMPQATRLIPVRLEAGRARPLAFQNSGDFAAAVGATGVVEIARGGMPPAQEGVPYYPFLR